MSLTRMSPQQRGLRLLQAGPGRRSRCLLWAKSPPASPRRLPAECGSSADAVARSNHSALQPPLLSSPVFPHHQVQTLRTDTEDMGCARLPGKHSCPGLTSGQLGPGSPTPLTAAYRPSAGLDVLRGTGGYAEELGRLTGDGWRGRRQERCRAPARGVTEGTGV